LHQAGYAAARVIGEVTALPPGLAAPVQASQVSGN